MIIRKNLERDTAQLVSLMLSYIVDFYRRPNPDEAAVKQLIEHLLEHQSQ